MGRPASKLQGCCISSRLSSDWCWTHLVCCVCEQQQAVCWFVCVLHCQTTQESRGRQGGMFCIQLPHIWLCTHFLLPAVPPQLPAFLHIAAFLHLDFCLGICVHNTQHTHNAPDESRPPPDPTAPLQAVLLEGRAWQARAGAVLQQPSVVAAAAAAIEADPCASICSLWNADIAGAAELEMNELEALISEYLRWNLCITGFVCGCVASAVYTCISEYPHYNYV